MRIGSGVEDSDDEVRELVLVSPLVVRPQSSDCSMSAVLCRYSA